MNARPDDGGKAPTPPFDACGGGPVDNPQIGAVIPVSIGVENVGAGQDGTSAPDNTQSDGLRPPRGYSWPPFEPGHTLSVHHGARSPRFIAAKAKEVHAALLEVAPYLDEAVFAPQVSRYLEATAREQLIHEYIIAVCADKGAGRVPQRLWEAATAATRLAAKLADGLGLSPMGHAELKALAGRAELTARSLADLGEDGRRIREGRLAEMASQDRSDGPQSVASGQDGELVP